jgi:hypothetical protein
MILQYFNVNETHFTVQTTQTLEVPWYIVALTWWKVQSNDASTPLSVLNLCEVHQQVSLELLSYSIQGQRQQSSSLLDQVQLKFKSLNGDSLPTYGN